MLPDLHKILFAVYALVTGAFVLWGFYRLYLRVWRGAPATEARFDNLPGRIGYAITTSLTQERVFRKRPAIGVLHSMVFYGFVYYLLVNVVDLLEGFFHFAIHSDNPFGIAYNLLADLLSAAVILGVIGLMIRRFFTQGKRDFKFNEKTPIHEWIKGGYIKRDSIIVASFIIFHVGSRMIAQSAKMAMEGGDPWQPFASGLGALLFGGLSEAAQMNWWIFGFWGALGSILAFMVYFPYSKHFHFVGAPLNYALKRPVNSGVLPPMPGIEAAMEQDEPKLGVEKLEDLEWPRMLDAYACIQCNRCQDVCPANATGKALSPAALEINKRMELNAIAAHASPFTLKKAAFEDGAATARPLLEYAISEEAVWGCTTCGACMQVCPVQDEQMLDIVDIRRNLVMVQGEFPPQLQTAFRGMERASNPWGISRDKRMEWAEGLKVPTIDENPEPDVIYWVGCAASYDPGAQKVARSFVQLLDKAGINYAVLGKKEACTGDSARRAGNEFLYLQLAQENVETLNEVRPKLIVATCPHCMNMIGQEYKQLGGDYQVIHHTEYLEKLVQAGQLPTAPLGDAVTYHDPCYLGRHNGVYDAPRSLITRMAGQVLELERTREQSFCCGAGGAQFWKEEEEGSERISDNRFKEIQARLDASKEGKVLAVGCPFCKSMMNSTPAKAEADDIVVKDVAELMLESVQRAQGEWVEPETPVAPAGQAEAPNTHLPEAQGEVVNSLAEEEVTAVTTAQVENAQPEPAASAAQPMPAVAEAAEKVERKAWTPGSAATPAAAPAPAPSAQPVAGERKAWTPGAAPAPAAPKDDVAPAAGERKAWTPGAAPASAVTGDDVQPASTAERKAWTPGVPPAPTAKDDVASASGTGERKAWNPGAAAAPASAPKDDVQPATSGQRQAWTPAAQKAVPAPDAVTPAAQTGATPARKAWTPGAAPAPAPAPDSDPADVAPVAEVRPTTQPQLSPETSASAPAARPKWTPGVAAPAAPAAGEAGLGGGQPISAQAVSEVAESAAPAPTPAPAASSAANPADADETGATGRPKWRPSGQ
ncbi:iron-sulfur-binding protein [Deinococcus piscis]|uniref:Iron-sulfur-binding protein n=1 Tax=Deinococcus piscis TaxID=394230 RepID=A0ABQ3KD01_9DEIO|nr:heterodisulfide reductase-related iron-sulfur binding cluster [Deinococcus piscis]GHG09110.1 iron-sulfur-binding protein [Deinococcus piscis]